MECVKRRMAIPLLKGSEGMFKCRFDVYLGLQTGAHN